MKLLNIKLFLFILIIIGAFLRFYNLNWSAPFYFHPDERNIAVSVSQLKFPAQMNPHFFAYGSFPIYIIYFFGIILNFFSPDNSMKVEFEQAIIISRAISAVLSISLIPLLYLIGQTLKNNISGILSAILGTFSVGLVQFAHFGTFEIWLTFLTVVLFYLCLKLIKSATLNPTSLIGIILGLLMAVKISNAALFLLPSLLLIWHAKSIKQCFLKIIYIVVVSLLTFIITNPFVLFDFSSFRSSMDYESSVAFGTSPVFYTQEFFNTIPVIFQFIRIYPFILNPLLTVLFVPSFIYLAYLALKQKNHSYYTLNLIFLMLLLPNAFLFAKWTRYIIPTLPFVYIILALTLTIFFENKKIKFFSMAFMLLTVTSVIFTLSYFITVFIRPDTRISAFNFAKNNLASNAKILSENYDLGITPFNSYFPNIKLFNFYEIDSSSQIPLINQDYIFLPSQRVLKTRILKSQEFPKGHKFYTSLINGKLGFNKIYETPCDIFCKITYINSPVFSFEQTANVFDRPTFFIFQRNNI